MRHRSDVRVLATRYSAGQLIGASSTRAASVLVRKHGRGAVPTEEVDKLVGQFHDWLVLAIDAAQAIPIPVDNEDDEDAAE